MTEQTSYKFDPHPTYDGLLKQARGLASLLGGAIYMNELYVDSIQKVSRRMLLIDSEEVKAERLTNSILTDSLLNAEDEIIRLRNLLVDNGIKYD